MSWRMCSGEAFGAPRTMAFRIQRMVREYLDRPEDAIVGRRCSDMSAKLLSDGEFCVSAGYSIRSPPLASIDSPTMYDAAGLARKAITSAISRGVPVRA